MAGRIITRARTQAQLDLRLPRQQPKGLCRASALARALGCTVLFAPEAAIAGKNLIQGDIELYTEGAGKFFIKQVGNYRTPKWQPTISADGFFQVAAADHGCSTAITVVMFWSPGEVSGADAAPFGFGSQDPTFWNDDLDASTEVPTIFAGSLVRADAAYKYTSYTWYSEGCRLISNSAASDIWRNGAKIKTGNPGAFAASGAALAIGSSANNGSKLLLKDDDQPRSGIALLAVFPRILSDAEMGVLTRNPFVLVEPLQDALFRYPVTATLPTLTNPTLVAAGGNTYQPRVTATYS